MRIVLSEALVAEIRRHAERTYPEECCGFLVGAAEAAGTEGPRELLRIQPMQNQVADERGRRFVIPPEELRRFEETLEGTGQAVVGFYHSHPDHPAVPSQFDETHAWPWYTYLVLAVEHGRPGEFGTFELDPEDRRFRPVPCTVGSSAAPVR